MITCGKCGADNQLGRVFCMKCGSKLELKAMTSAYVDEQVKVSWLRRYIKFFVLALALALLAFVVVALYPKDSLIGQGGTPYGRDNVESTLANVSAMPAGETREISFSEQDLNAYLELSKAKSMNVKSFSVDIMPRYFYVRMVNQLFSLKLFKYELAPTLSYDFACVPRGGRVAVPQVYMGHLRLYGPLKNMAVGRVAKRLSGEREWALCRNITDIKVEENRITLTVKK